MSVDEEGGAAASAGLSTRRVVLEAIRLADAEGVHGLSMRRLATVLNAGAMTLYHYVANKEELLDAMVDVVFDEIALPREDVEWRQAIRERALSARGCSLVIAGRSGCSIRGPRRGRRTSVITRP